MQTQYFAELVVLLIATIASIAVYVQLTTLQRSQFSSQIRATTTKGLSISKSTMFLTQLAYACDSVGAAPEEMMSTVSKASATTMGPIHLEQGDDASKNTYATSTPITVEDVELPGYCVVDGIHLKRNGHGLRSLTYFGIGIRIYVASMYTSKAILSAEQATSDDNGPIQLDFTFLRYVRRSQVVSAWTQQLDHSITCKDYDTYKADRQRFIDLASGGPIENQGTQSIQLVGDETRIIDQGKLTGVIQGKDFQRSFLSMWFGPMAVAEDLKANLLRGDQHLRFQREREQVEQELQSTLVKA